MKLSELKIGQSAVITEVGGKGSLRQHLLDMGVLPGTVATLIKFAPMGDPIEIKIHDYELTLRLHEASEIEIDRNLRIEKETKEEDKKSIKPVHFEEHPGLGEEGKYHNKEDENPLPDDSALTFALVGNQNAGKTTLFNQLTGSNQHVGNFPGVTVDRKSGNIKGREDTLITDLPGIYSLSPFSNEEIVSRSFILDEKPTGIINIIDATNLERSLYLTLQLMELNVPIVLALNMMDELVGNGGSIRINEMEDLLGIPIVPISALKGDGINELVNHALHIAKYQEKPGIDDFCEKNENGGAVHRCLHGIMHLIEDHAAIANIPLRFAATKIAEGDKLVMDALNLSENEKEMLEHIIVQMEEERGLDRAAAIADMRYSFITKVTEQTLVKPRESKERERSRKIDKVLTGKYTAIPSFILIMGLVFFLTFNVVGSYLQNMLQGLIDNLTANVDIYLSNIGASSFLHSLIIDGIFKGVGSVVSFLPIIVVLFFFLSLLEDSGYMARIAFVMDKLLRKIGLSGRSIVPMLIGFGCTVPSVMACRTLSSERDRKLTMILSPFMSCPAKLPIYAFFSVAFFPEHSGLVTISLYVLGIVLGVIVAIISKNTVFKGEAIPFVMELPNYRMPGVKNVTHLLWDKAKDFLERAFTIIFLASIIIWFLQTFDFGLNMVYDAQFSILAKISGVIAPIFTPLGFGDWRISTALITGLLAKESVVSTLTVLVGEASLFAGILTVDSVIALLVFCLLYTPCIAAIASIKRELGTKWALGIVLFQCGLAWIMAFIAKYVAILII